MKVKLFLLLDKAFGTEELFLPLPNNLDAARPANKPEPCGAVAGVWVEPGRSN